MRNKNGIAPLFVFAIVVAVIVVIYVILYLPFPSFTKIRTIVNYFLIILFWVGLQGLIIYGYYRAGKFVVSGFYRYKNFAMRIAEKTKKIYEV